MFRNNVKEWILIKMTNILHFREFELEIQVLDELGKIQFDIPSIQSPIEMNQLNIKNILPNSPWFCHFFVLKQHNSIIF